MHAIILARGRGFENLFDEMQNGAIWGHYRVSYNIEFKHNFNDFDRQEFLKIVQNLPFVS